MNKGAQTAPKYGTHSECRSVHTTHFDYPIFASPDGIYTHAWDAYSVAVFKIRKESLFVIIWLSFALMVWPVRGVLIMDQHSVAILPYRRLTEMFVEPRLPQILGLEIKFSINNNICTAIVAGFWWRLQNRYRTFAVNWHSGDDASTAGAHRFFDLIKLLFFLNWN